MSAHRTDSERISGALTEMLGIVSRRSDGGALQIMTDSGLTLPQITALHALRWGGPMSIGGLVDEIGLSVSATSHLVERLVERGLVDRTEDPDDRRLKRVAVTDTGKAIVDRLADARHEDLMHAIDMLEPSLRSALAMVLESAVQQLQIPGERRCARPPQEPS
jgi:DNA-binding MarR family transcriptional regulator